MGAFRAEMPRRGKVPTLRWGKHTHVTGDMHRKASGIVGEFMSDFVVKG